MTKVFEFIYRKMPVSVYFSKAVGFTIYIDDCLPNERDEYKIKVIAYLESEGFYDKFLQELGI